MNDFPDLFKDIVQNDQKNKSTHDDESYLPACQLEKVHWIYFDRNTVHFSWGLNENNHALGV